MSVFHVDNEGRHPRRDPGQSRRPVVPFDKARSRANSPETNAGFAHNVGDGMFFRCTDRDKAPAREVVTARLMGDPAPDRPRPSEPMPNRICTESGPVLLTFNELAAATGRA